MDWEHISPSGNITYSVDKLEQKQLLVRSSAQNDRRVIFAELTEQGRRLLDEISPKHTEAIHLTVSGLTPEGQVQAAQLLKKLGLAAQKGFDRNP